MGPLKPFPKSLGSFILQSLSAAFRKDQSCTSSLLCRKFWTLHHWEQKQSRYLSCEVLSCSCVGMAWGSFLSRTPEIIVAFLCVQHGQQARGERPEASYTCSNTASQLVSCHGPGSRRRPLSRMLDSVHSVLLCRRSLNSIKLFVRTSVVRFHVSGVCGETVIFTDTPGFKSTCPPPSHGCGQSDEVMRSWM